MPVRLDTREQAVEAVLEQVRHAQAAARRVEADIVARRCAEDIVAAFAPDAAAPAVTAVPDLDPAYEMPNVADLVGRVIAAEQAETLPPGSMFVRADDDGVSPYAGGALIMGDRGDWRYASDEAGLRGPVTRPVYVVFVATVPVPGVGEYARTVEQLDALPLNSVVRDAERHVCERYVPTRWSCRGVAVTPFLPARVLEVGGEQ